MNILHHKSWHVRTKANIERVRKDEEKAANEEKERERKIALAEQEARTELLRVKASKRKSDSELEGVSSSTKKHIVNSSEGSSTSSAVKIYTNSGHINFFSEIEAGEKSKGNNADNEADKKAEKEKWEKDIGLLTYLDQSTQEKPAWYLNKRETAQPEHDLPKKGDKLLKNSYDPLVQMKTYVDKTVKYREGHMEQQNSHKHKKKKKNKDKNSEKEKSSSKTIEQLRAERLKREQEERKRTQDMLANKNKRQGSQDLEQPVNERQRGYNNMFNPDLARRPKDRHRSNYTYN